MANKKTGNVWHIDSTGALDTKKTLVSSIIFSPAAADDILVLRTSSTGSDVITLQAATAKQSILFTLQLTPIVFPNGVYVQTITTGAKAMLVLATPTGGAS